MVAASSGFEQVGNDNTLTTHTKTNLSVAKNGFLYIYVSNETPNVDVFFDNLTVSHIRGPILEETHYYPFGLTMAGISSKALAFGDPVNRTKFQNQEFATREFADGSGLEMYEFKWRVHDPQTGRFWQVDPLANEYVYNSTYAFSENKVIAHVELEGLESSPVNNNNSTRRDNATANSNSSNKTPTAQKSKSSGFSFTAALTFGASVGVDFDIKGTPISLQANVSAGEIDVLGIRENNSTFLGKSNGTTTSRSYVGLNVLGIGASEVLETKTTDQDEYSETLIQSVGVGLLSQETTYSNLDKNGGVNPTEERSLQFNLKGSLFVGFEIEIKIPLPKSGDADGLRPGNHPDNTRVKPIVIPLAK